MKRVDPLWLRNNAGVVSWGIPKERWSHGNGPLRSSIDEGGVTARIEWPIGKHTLVVVTNQPCA